MEKPKDKVTKNNKLALKIKKVPKPSPALENNFATPEAANSDTKPVAQPEQEKISEAAVESAHKSLAAIEEIDTTPALKEAEKVLEPIEEFSEVAPQPNLAPDERREVLNSLASSSGNAGNPLGGVSPEMLEAMKERTDLVVIPTLTPETVEEVEEEKTVFKLDEAKEKYKAQLSAHEKALAELRANKMRSATTYDADPEKEPGGLAPDQEPAAPQNKAGIAPPEPAGGGHTE
ncbi:MAG: hypothetical protein GC136_08310 [Alphaproteobacteria bacterium]|nr:hypothetical protein [Alphaproteobacteria bacterium]